MRPPDDTTARGIVAAEYSDRIVLKDATVYGAGGSGTPAAGLLEIFRVNVSTIQVIPPRTEPA
jgi:hypothetical protein